MLGRGQWKAGYTLRSRAPPARPAGSAGPHRTPHPRHFPPTRRRRAQAAAPAAPYLSAGAARLLAPGRGPRPTEPPRPGMESGGAAPPTSLPGRGPGPSSLHSRSGAHRRRGLPGTPELQLPGRPPPSAPTADGLHLPSIAMMRSPWTAPSARPGAASGARGRRTRRGRRRAGRGGAGPAGAGLRGREGRGAGGAEEGPGRRVRAEEMDASRAARRRRGRHVTRPAAAPPPPQRLAPGFGPGVGRGGPPRSPHPRPAPGPLGGRSRAPKRPLPAGGRQPESTEGRAKAAVSTMDRSQLSTGLRDPHPPGDDSLRSGHPKACLLGFCFACISQILASDLR